MQCIKLSTFFLVTNDSRDAKQQWIVRYWITVYKFGKNSSEKFAYKKIEMHEKNIFMMPKNEQEEKLVPI